MKPVPAHHTMEGTKGFGRNDIDKKGDGRDASENGNGGVNVRPDESSRFIFLSSPSPPGVGKSTFVHMACEHAGYRLIEVNASDERTKDALTERVTRGNHKYVSALRPVLPYARKLDVRPSGPERASTVLPLET